MVWNNTKLHELYGEQLDRLYGHRVYINPVSIDLALESTSQFRCAVTLLTST